MKRQSFKIGNTTIIIRENTPDVADVRRCYDVCNELFRGIDECFYTKNETRNKNIILSRKQKKEAMG